MRYVSERILYQRIGRVERQLQVCSPGHVWTRDGFCPCGDGQVQSTAYANAYAERFVRTIKESCLNRMILVGERSLSRAIGGSSRTTIRNAITKDATTNCSSATPRPGDTRGRSRVGHDSAVY
jgi:hypothetical protein